MHAPASKILQQNSQTSFSQIPYRFRYCLPFSPASPPAPPVAQISFRLFPELFRTQSALPDRKAFLRHTPDIRQIQPASAVCKVPVPYCPVRSKKILPDFLKLLQQDHRLFRGRSPLSSPATAAAVSQQNRTCFRSRAEWKALHPSIFQARCKGCNSRCPRYRPRRESCCQNHTLHHRPPGRKPLFSDSSNIPPEVFQAGALPRQSGLLCVTLPRLPLSGRTGFRVPFR